MRALLAALLVPAAAWAQGSYETELLREGGPSHNRIVLVILGDGYTAAEQGALSIDASRLAEGLFAASPYREYADFFNIVLVHVISTESGADHPERGVSRDTALGAAYNCWGIQRLICVDSATALGIAAAAVPEVTYALVVVNDAEYGGSGGEVPVVSTNSDSVLVLQHELAHTFGNLADEYDTPYPGFPACDPLLDCPEANATLHATRDTAKWSAWIDAATPVPTPPSIADRVGLFEGARYLPAGIYRPMADCLMRQLAAEFCPVCTEALIGAAYGYVVPFDEATPASPVILDGWEESALLRVLYPESQTLSVSWRVDGVLQGTAAGSSFEFDGRLTGSGVHTIEAVIEETSSSLRQLDPSLLRHSVSWSVEATGGWCGDGVVNGPELCDDGAGARCSPGCGLEPAPPAGEAEALPEGCACTGTASGWLLPLFLPQRRRRRPARL